MSNPGRILVVDDDDDIRDIISLILGSEGFEVTGLPDGHQVLNQAGELQPDVILLDVMLGDMDGRDICKCLKTTALTQKIPVIIISASHDPFSSPERRCLADDFLGKPFDINELVARVRKQMAA